MKGELRKEVEAKFRAILGGDRVEKRWIDEEPIWWLDLEGGQARGSGLNAVFGRRGKGLPLGRITELYGSEGTGKSTLLYWLLGIVQAAGGLAVLADVEKRFDAAWAAKFGLDAEQLIILGLGQVEEGKKKKKAREEGMEDLFEKFHAVIQAKADIDEGAPMLIGWDSIAATPSREELKDDSYGSTPMALQARALSAGIRKLHHFLARRNVGLVALNQMRTAGIGGFFTYDAPTGGKAMRFYSRVRVRISRDGPGSEAHSAAKLGNRKNTLGPPGRQAKFKVSYKGAILWHKPREQKK